MALWCKPSSYQTVGRPPIEAFVSEVQHYGRGYTRIFLDSSADSAQLGWRGATFDRRIYELEVPHLFNALRIRSIDCNPTEM
jgi:hypothetical protein